MTTTEQSIVDDQFQTNLDLNLEAILKHRFANKSDIDFIFELILEIYEVENDTTTNINEQKEILNESILKNKILIFEIENIGNVGFIWFEENDIFPFGFDYGHWNKKYLWICYTGTAKNWRRKRIATFMYKQLELFALKRNINELILDVYQSNPKSISFHTSLGFKPIVQLFQKNI
eukprot:TRINITY_DN927_c1_g1_i2.p1 TRINITY_DN927_c1_g1~~TRINITY_DN927_c1_g1_i2.p1  ORF type:complete len:176 (-),score=68.57 TRINITY_DN927_c1_g1_i2:30-557(-)